MNLKGMRRNDQRKWRCDRVVRAATLVIAGLLAGCSANSGIGGPGPTPSGAASMPATNASFSDKVSTFFSGSSAKAPQPVAGAQPDVFCPPAEVRQGASTMSIGPAGQTMALKYQGSFLRTARECAVIGSDMVLKVGVQGRVVVGPAGGPGEVIVPVRIAVVDERPGGMRPIVTKLIRIPVTIASADVSTLFSHIEEGLSFPLPTPTVVLDDYIVYVGFDPQAAEVQGPQKQRPPTKSKPKPTASNG
jgi:hypothetical protein